MGYPGGNGNGCWFESRISRLQLAVYWRLCVIIFFNSFLFFLDIYTVCSVRPPRNRTEHHRVEPETGVLNGSMWRDDSDSECVCLSYGQTLYLIGLLLGSLFGGALSDRYGRCAVLQVCVCVHAVCGLMPAAFHHPLVFIALRCLTGVCSSCMHICSFSLALLGFSFSLGMVVQAPLAYTFPSWTQLHLALGLPQILCLPIIM
ncbi:hypothetical protein CRUP_018845 [Coryphaenoides rupestris]|nr:hypothetical protein CRUP_018845 [Coryphaenoides rupestris]